MMLWSRDNLFSSRSLLSYWSEYVLALLKKGYIGRYGISSSHFVLSLIQSNKNGPTNRYTLDGLVLQMHCVNALLVSDMGLRTPEHTVRYSALAPCLFGLPR